MHDRVERPFLRTISSTRFAIAVKPARAAPLDGGRVEVAADELPVGRPKSRKHGEEAAVAAADVEDRFLPGPSARW
jgi:hypothetical protein